MCTREVADSKSYINAALLKYCVPDCKKSKLEKEKKKVEAKRKKREIAANCSHGGRGHGQPTSTKFRDITSNDDSCFEEEAEKKMPHGDGCSKVMTSDVSTAADTSSSSDSGSDECMCPVQ